ncbi:MAG: PIG-L family deacetylase [Lachnospiraceae bacterium]|nr:PIG-L family deacetylase [Lachnospiraceae bacterium]MDE7205436.1 PIG-L family deacetylase [Lachnospiraceae bacterium]
MKILAVGAHLDDIELACGGTLAKAIAHGHDVKMIVMSKSGYSNYDGKVIRTEENAITEGRRAAEMLGVNDIEILDYDTKDIPYHSQVIEALDERIQKYKPEIVFTHWIFDTHQAHEGVAKSTITAARRHNNVYMYEPIYPAGRSYMGFRPQMYVDIGGFEEQKLKALRMHKTEYEKFGDQWIEGTKARAAYRGYEMGKQYAEAFEIVRCEMIL